LPLQPEEARRARLLDHQRSRVDRRSVRIRLTAQGQEIRRIVDTLYQKHVKTVEQVGGISSEEFATLNKSLHASSGSGLTRSCIGSEIFRLSRRFQEDRRLNIGHFLKGRILPVAKCVLFGLWKLAPQILAFRDSNSRVFLLFAVLEERWRPGSALPR
jgi:hypothetical protein